MFEKDSFSSSYSAYYEDDFLVRNIVLTHDPDGRYLDSKLLLQAVKNVMCSTATADVSDIYNDGTIIEVVGSEETLEHIIYKISSEMLLKCSANRDLHTKTMVLLHMLRNYEWDAKVVLILAALATSYGECWLIMKMYPYQHLASLAELLQQFPFKLHRLRMQMKALTMLVNTMVEMANCVVKFENLPVNNVLLGDKAVSLTKTQIYIATYRIFKESLEVSAQITDFIDMEQEKISQSTTIAAWGLSYTVSTLRRLSNDLREQVDLCHEQIETKLYQKLLDIFRYQHADNQEVVQMFFTVKDETPIKDCSSRAQVDISELGNKVVLILVSTPELLPIEQIHLLAERTQSRGYYKKMERSYEVVWIPISASGAWNFYEKRSFSIVSDSLPWLCIRKPWLLSSTVVNFIKQEWNYDEQQPLMVALDSQGMVSNKNAMDMLIIWGAKAFPFSTSKEKQLWEEQNLNLKILLDGVDSSLLQLVEEGRNICLYGGDDMCWTSKFNSRMTEIRTAGINFEVINIARKSQLESSPNNLSGTNQSPPCDPQVFKQSTRLWLRLESMKRSILRSGYTASDHEILKVVLWLLEMNDNSKSWVLIGNKNSVDLLNLQEMQVIECLDLFQVWRENVGKLGLVKAIKIASEPHFLCPP